MNKQVKAWFQWTTYYGTMAVVVSIGVYFTFQLMLGTLGANIEMRFIQPLQDFRITEVVCLDGEDALLKGVVHKTEYLGGTEAEFVGLTLFDRNVPPNRLPWTRYIDSNNITRDSSPATRPPGEQTMEIVAADICSREFYAYTRHKSPITGNLLRQKWGPFNVQPMEDL